MVSDNESWVVDSGESVIEKRIDSGADSLSPLEKLIYCLWVADYGMRNGGDFETSDDLYADFQREGARLAQLLNLQVTSEAFKLAKEDLQREYFNRFDAICDEIRRHRDP
jgi:hypothetical protein